MAEAPQLQRVRDEVTCSICLELYTDPVYIECGHNFCRSCITQCWEAPGSGRSCPLCKTVSREATLRPNRELRNIVEMSGLNLSPENPQDAHLCPKHQQKLQLFCDEDHTLLCVICRESKEHRAHTVCPIEEAAQEHKKTLSSHKNKLSEEMEEMQLWAAEESSRASALEENYKNQTEKIISTFELLKQFLEKEKQQLLSKLKKEHEENMKKMREKLTKLEISQSTHRGLITELEEKCQQQDVEMLKDVKSILRRCDVKILKPEKDANVEKILQSIGEDSSLQEKLLELKATFPAELEWKYVKGFACSDRKGFQSLMTLPEEEERFGMQAGSWRAEGLHRNHRIQATFHAELEWKFVKGFASAVTLDPDTAHPKLILSEYGRSVRHGDRDQGRPNTPQRFSYCPIVLGRERLSSGRHYWEVEVGDKTDWDLGVCDEAVDRKGTITLAPKDGYWTVRLRDGKYEALTSPPTLLTPRVPPRAVGLFLDYEAGRLSVYNMDDRSLLFTFSGASFPPTLRPFFCPGLTQGGVNAGALRLLPVTGGGVKRPSAAPAREVR